MDATRRAFLRTTASAGIATATAGGVAMMAMSSAAAASDPMAVLVREYRRQWTVFTESEANQVYMNSIPGSPEFRAADAELDGIIARTWGPLNDRFERGEDLPPVTTIEGATECVAFVLQQTDGCEMEDKDRHILRAVAVFLEGRAV